MRDYLHLHHLRLCMSICTRRRIRSGTHECYQTAGNAAQIRRFIAKRKQCNVTFPSVQFTRSETHTHTRPLAHSFSLFLASLVTFPIHLRSILSNSPQDFGTSSPVSWLLHLCIVIDSVLSSCDIAPRTIFTVRS